MISYGLGIKLGARVGSQSLSVQLFVSRMLLFFILAWHTPRRLSHGL